MSQTSASGAGGSAAPGWYADPHDPAQLRWWSGTTWTEHVSPASTPPAAQQQAAAQPPTAQVQSASVQSAPVQSASVQSTSVAAGDALPSRRSMRDTGVESVPDAPLAAAGWGPQPAAQPSAPQPAAQQPAAQQPAAQPQNLWNQDTVAQPGQQEQQQQQQPAAQQQAAEQQNLWNQPVAQPAAPQDTWNQPASQPLQPQVPQATQPQQGYQLPQQQNAWSQPPLQPTGSAPAPQETAQQPQSGIDLLFGTPQPTASLSVADARGGANGGYADNGYTDSARADSADSSQWGLSPSTRHGGASSHPTGSSTGWVWIIALSPAIAAAAIGYALKTNGTDLTSWMLQAAVAAPYLLVLLFAVADRSRLATFGFDRPAAWTWAALSAPVYLIARGSVVRREYGGGSGPLVLWCVSVVVSAVGLVGYGIVMNSPLIPGLPG